MHNNIESKYRNTDSGPISDAVGNLWFVSLLINGYHINQISVKHTINRTCKKCFFQYTINLVHKSSVIPLGPYLCKLVTTYFCISYSSKVATYIHQNWLNLKHIRHKFRTNTQERSLWLKTQGKMLQCATVWLQRQTKM